MDNVPEYLKKLDEGKNVKDEIGQCLYGFIIVVEKFENRLLYLLYFLLIGFLFSCSRSRIL